MASRTQFKKEYVIQAKAYHNRLRNDIVKEWGRHALNDIEVTNIGRQLLGNKYRGTFPQDRAPFTNRSKYFIINVDKSGFPGSHWVAIYQDNNKTMYVYDSFARPSKRLLPHLYDKAKANGYKLINANRGPDQCKKTNICGPISLAFLKATEMFGIDAARHI